MQALFESGRVIDFILMFMALEAIAFAYWRYRYGRGPGMAQIISNLASGAALMLAVRFALTGSEWWVVAACLMASFVTHAWEVMLRMKASNTS